MSSVKIPKIGFISLGCPKAGSDTEKIMTRVKTQGYEISSSYDKSDVVVVNTCGFIDSAIEESLNTIDEALKSNGNVIVTGCLGEKKNIIEERFKNLIAITGSEADKEVVDIINKVAPKPHDSFIDLIPKSGLRLTPSHYAYIKISEGCNHKCSFCIIPSMRGKLVSRTPEDILGEAQNLVDSGVTELIIISQDTSAYGVDFKVKQSFWDGKPVKRDLYHLAKELKKFGVWVRFHYIYPYPHIDYMIELMDKETILPYLDVPFQHASPRILKSMKRPADAEDNLKRIQAWREINPNIALRSTFIVGYPGETDHDFEQLIEFIKEANLDNVGCFEYSNVEGATAKLMSDQIPDYVKKERYNHLMETQKTLSEQKLKSLIGSIQHVVVDEVTDDFALARSFRSAPDVDGVIYLKDPEGLMAGDRLNVKITGNDAYNLFAGPLDD
ncbi:ribosomal protein S12 methylthiotransferase [Methylophilales bacterium MBRSG12]|uniref:Ribosomal protein uS12 methylthiotransferase RimO n=1 Tax=Methylophilales bacterium MBRS-H7 TaxID=1623450 RepID=A0A0H4JCW6_9PROT|nr:ribosomal protein S12 methylthiotransferase [Methylophilales bacterium MBRSF5]AKO66332.1 ribosomal protein S12 methylthiotransferase [Methylophilales bacterium MBRS-H7]AKO67648.1 ribosomal protein S12 methylthiotransferase [Methylophilales bacterium MBRSG12]